MLESYATCSALLPILFIRHIHVHASAVIKGAAKMKCVQSISTVSTLFLCQEKKGSTSRASFCYVALTSKGN